jgi:hypothetical protein
MSNTTTPSHIAVEERVQAVLESRRTNNASGQKGEDRTLIAAAFTEGAMSQEALHNEPSQEST